jgi:hypothetical protein
VNGVAFRHLLGEIKSLRCGVEIDAYRVEQARDLGIDTLQANTLDVRSPAEAFSLLYLNPPHDFEIGETNNQRLELVFLEHTYRWLKPGGVLAFVIPQFSPDGHWIAYTSDESGSDEIYVRKFSACTQTGSSNYRGAQAADELPRR